MHADMTAATIQSNKVISNEAHPGLGLRPSVTGSPSPVTTRTVGEVCALLGACRTRWPCRSMTLGPTCAKHCTKLQETRRGRAGPRPTGLGGRHGATLWRQAGSWGPPQVPRSFSRGLLAGRAPLGSPAPGQLLCRLCCLGVKVQLPGRVLPRGMREPRRRAGRVSLGRDN